MITPSLICPVLFDGGDLCAAQAFADKAGLPLQRVDANFDAKQFYKRDVFTLERSATNSQFYLVYSAQDVLLCPRDRRLGNPVGCDFVQGKNRHRFQYGGGKGQLIAKAVGISGAAYPSVLDATAGLGGDAFVLASLGCRVQMLERSHVVHELLRSGLANAGMIESVELRPVIDRMTLIEGDALQWLGRQEQGFVDVIYLDPMFPTREKSAQVKREMQFFHQVVGPDEDSDALLALAQEKAEYRVVVKRGLRSPLLSNREPTYQLKGKSSRYDVYVNRSLSHKTL